MKSTKKYILLTISVMVLGVIILFANTQTFHWPFKSTSKVTTEEINGNEEVTLNQFSSQISSELKAITKAHHATDNIRITQAIYEVDGTDSTSISEPDTLVLIKMGDKLLVENDGMIRAQTPKQSLLIVPDEELLVIQDPDIKIYDMFKDAQYLYEPDSIAYLYKKAEMTSKGNGIQSITLWPAYETDVVKTEVVYEAATHKIVKMIIYYEEFNDIGELVKYSKVIETNYEPVNSKDYDFLFNFKNFYKETSKGKLEPVKEFEGYEVHNSTRKMLIKNLKNSKNSKK